jgi:hypothetical protein
MKINNPSFTNTITSLGLGSTAIMIGGDESSSGILYNSSYTLDNRSLVNKSYLNTIYYYNTAWNVSWDSPQSENGTFSLTSIKAMFYVKGTYLNFSWRFNISNSTSDNNMNFVFLLPQKIDSSYYEFSSNQRILSEISFNNVKYYNSSPYINYTDLKWYNAESSYNNSIQFYISFDSDISSFNSDITVKGMAEILI